MAKQTRGKIMANRIAEIILDDLGSKTHYTEQAAQVCEQIAEIIKGRANIHSPEIVVKQVMTKAERIVGAIRKAAEKQSGLEMFWSQWGTLRRPYR
jgi:L-arabinose isomerase